MAISQSFDDLLKHPRSLPEESAIAVHFKGGRGGILFGFDTQSHQLTADHHILPHAGALAGHNIAAVVEEARRRASILASLLRSSGGQSGDYRSERQSDTDQAVTTPQISDRSSLPPWPWR
jgi:hypothetical protein